MKSFFILLLILIAIFTIWLLPDEHGDYPVAFERLVSQVFKETVTPESIKERYQAGELTILLVPGHDPEYPGAEVGDLKESELTLDLATKIKADLEKIGGWKVLSTRNFTTGKYEPEFATYFEREREAINSFRSQLRHEFASLLASGEVAPPEQEVYHNFAPTEVATRLYGINRWSNDHNVDLTLHLHFNDYPGRGRTPRYGGFSIYIPERQLPNARVSRELAETIQRELTQIMPISNLPSEAGSPVEDQELIAVGANGSRLSAALLVEYGYLYESQFKNKVIREAVLTDLAHRTVRGLATYFSAPKTVPATSLLPHFWAKSLQTGIKGDRDVLALQTALHRDGLYPTVGKNLNNCPINGNFGPCVQAAVVAFQTRHNLLPATGVVDTPTLAKLNELYSRP